MAQIWKIIVDSLMAIFFILTMLFNHRQIHVTFAWILAGLVVIHLLLNWRIIYSWVRNLFR